MNSKKPRQFCPFCGAKLNEKTGLCPHCDTDEFQNYKKTLWRKYRKLMKAICAFWFGISALLLVLSLPGIVLITPRMSELILGVGLLLFGVLAEGAFYKE